MIADRDPQLLDSAAVALRQGNLAQARRQLAGLLRVDSDNLAAWRLLLRALQEPAHRQRAAQEILRLDPSDQEAQAALDAPNRALPRTGSRARVPAFGELSQDDDPFGELAAYRARNGLSPPSNPTVSAGAAAVDNRVADVARVGRHVRSKQRRFNLPTPTLSARVPRALQFRPRRSLSILAVLSASILLGAAATFLPKEPIFQAQGLLAEPKPTSESILVHPALSHISYLTVESQALSFDEARRNTLAPQRYDLYHFDGLRGMLLSVDVISLDPLLDPVVEVYQPDGQLLGWNDNGDFNLSKGTLDARYSVVLPMDGRFLISVGGIVGEGKYIVSMRNH